MLKKLEIKSTQRPRYRPAGLLIVALIDAVPSETVQEATE